MIAVAKYSVSTLVNAPCADRLEDWKDSLQDEHTLNSVMELQMRIILLFIGKFFDQITGALAHCASPGRLQLCVETVSGEWSIF